jgi:hypothetical protein
MILVVITKLVGMHAMAVDLGFLDAFSTIGLLYFTDNVSLTLK